MAGLEVPPLQGARSPAPFPGPARSDAKYMPSQGAEPTLQQFETNVAKKSGNSFAFCEIPRASGSIRMSYHFAGYKRGKKPMPNASTLSFSGAVATFLLAG